MTNHDDFSSTPEPSRGAVRRRRLPAFAAGGTAVLVTAVLTVLTVGSATAAAPTSGQEVTDQPAALDTSDQASETVLLPTGDQVRMQPDGTIGLLPAEGREDVGFLAVPAADGSGDTIIVPQDKSEEILSGTEDSRRYNVTQLMADGHADAADVETSELEQYAGLPPTTDDAGAEAAQTLTVTVKDRFGGIPDGSGAKWFDTADFAHNGSLEFDDGVATADLAPGTYILIYSFGNGATDTEPGEDIHGLTHVVIGDQSMGLLLDGAKAQPVTVEVERPDATLDSDILTLAATAPDGSGVELTSFGSVGIDRYLMPQTEVPGYDLAFKFQPTLTGSKGGPYAYNLTFAQHGGFPDDTAFSVADDELAAVQTEYRGFGKAVDGYTCNEGDHVEPIGKPGCFLAATSFPSERLELFTADPAIDWSNLIEGGLYHADDDLLLVDGFHEQADFAFEPGESERTFPHGPLTAGASRAGLFNADGVTYIEAGATLGASINGEQLHLLGYTGDATLFLDCEQIDHVAGIDPFGGFGFALTKPAAGRYILAVDGTRGTAIGPFATTSAVEWTFDLDPASVDPEGSLLTLPAIGITAEGIDSGWTKDRHQELTLELLDVMGEAVTAREMTFEVSYNNGRTWKAVDVDLDGSTGTVELDHPRTAQYVSTRLTATDETGTEVTQTTIRSYGLH
ncbi:hypothetical protein [Glycomyces sp. NPDC021274]|uniref:hypothetical protein n=1 Tax=Glycomyces sp. NPDC021274 TaxID=3155120 RepID=UPI0033D6AD30